MFCSPSAVDDDCLPMMVVFSAEVPRTLLPINIGPVVVPVPILVVASPLFMLISTDDNVPDFRANDEPVLVESPIVNKLPGVYVNV